MITYQVVYVIVAKRFVMAQSLTTAERLARANVPRLTDGDCVSECVDMLIEEKKEPPVLPGA